MTLHAYCRPDSSHITVTATMFSWLGKQDPSDFEQCMPTAGSKQLPVWSMI
jgi:hypothetical protein